jgi:hypothetical protein
MSFSPGALGLTPKQLAFIVQDEAASLEQAEEAARRMLHNPQFTQGQLRSPAAFYRGILRRVVAECPKAARTAPPARPSAATETAGRILKDLVERLTAPNPSTGKEETR